MSNFILKVLQEYSYKNLFLYKKETDCDDLQNTENSFLIGNGAKTTYLSWKDRVHLCVYSSEFLSLHFFICCRGIVWGSPNSASHWPGVEWQLQPWKHRLLLL